MLRIGATTQTKKQEALLDRIESFRARLAELAPAQPCESLGFKTNFNLGWGYEEILCVAGVDPITGRLPASQDWAALRLEPLRRLMHGQDQPPAELYEAMACCRAMSSSPHPPPAALLHAAVPQPVTGYSRPVALLAAFCLADAGERISAWYAAADTVSVDFTPSLQELGRRAAASIPGRAGLILMNRGLLAVGADLETCLENQESLALIASKGLPVDIQDGAPIAAEADPVEALPGLRQEWSARAGRPFVLQRDVSPRTLGWLQDFTCRQALLTGSALPELAALTRPPVGAAGEQSLLPWSNAAWEDDAPRLLLDPVLGLIAAGDSISEASRLAQTFAMQAEAVYTAQRHGKYASLPGELVNDALRWEPERRAADRPFTGEVALVTGAASGIGKACCTSLLARGSAVVGLDINPAIQQMLDDPSYLGLVCDITDESAVRSCLRETALRFGGLDMIVLNAGLFPGGCPIGSLSLADFLRIINVNLSSNLVLLREAYPLLKAAPRYGRVVVIGSKNVCAPGMGAVAYSSSKAGLTQMARVAALEWGPDHIRVNIVHPDAVFDTALYTEEVLQARAAHYGLTVEQYKKRNLLKAEITSHDIAEMVAEMCGPLFRVVTGAQVPMDGGNDRTI